MTSKHTNVSSNRVARAHRQCAPPAEHYAKTFHSRHNSTTPRHPGIPGQNGAGSAPQEEQLSTTIKALRRATGLTQEEFCARFRIPLGTLRDWEQGRSEPDKPARAYLRAIAGDAAAVSRALEMGAN